ncbi:MAG: aspartate ammonia-lyase [Alphaproteobacteria bacterium]|nr:aspartate ammonia-lyase [Alphaproteobacteria bacterium]
MTTPDQVAVETRSEHDALGTLDLPAGCLWGIHTQRALGNFPSTGRRVPAALIRAIASVKHAAAVTNGELGFLDKDVAEAIAAACEAVSDGGVDVAHFPLDALQGGAGTSTNMNVNEVVANLALKALGRPLGHYESVHPLHHVNLHQSTNDVYPTALRIAAIAGVRSLSDAMARLQGAFQEKETAFQAIPKLGRTEMQAAVPMTLGQEFSAFAEAIARDRWRTFKCEERLRLVNLGGTAIGTGLTAPRAYIFRVIEVLRALTGMGLARNENVIDGTANVDAFVEVSGILKASAANLSKIAADLRLLHFLGEIALPGLQAGSSIMPGKINPVMPEALMQIGMAVRANDAIVTECAAHGTLQINEFMPLLAWALLDSIAMLEVAAESFCGHVRRIAADAKRCAGYLSESATVITAFLPQIGYERALSLVAEFNDSRKTDLRAFLTERLGEDLVRRVLSPANLVCLGYDG